MPSRRVCLPESLERCEHFPGSGHDGCARGLISDRRDWIIGNERSDTRLVYKLLSLPFRVTLTYVRVGRAAPCFTEGLALHTGGVHPSFWI